MLKALSLSLSAMLVLTLFAGAASADTIIVTQVALTFDPADITIQEGDTVQWVWTNGTHTVTEGTGPFPTGGEAFDGLLTNANPTFSVTFDAAFLAANPRPGNLYDYYCIPHFIQAQVGSVTVMIGGPVVPTVSEWGAILLGTLLLGGGAWILSRRRLATA